MSDDKLTQPQREILKRLQNAKDLYGCIPAEDYVLLYKAGKVCGNLIRKGFLVRVPAHYQLTRKGIDYRGDQ